MYDRKIMLIQGTMPSNISISGLHDGIEHTWSGSAESTKLEQIMHKDHSADHQRDHDRLEKRADGREPY